jgi:hypothetical protein
MSGACVRVLSERRAAASPIMESFCNCALDQIVGQKATFIVSQGKTLDSLDRLENIRKIKQVIPHK